MIEIMLVSSVLLWIAVLLNLVLTMALLRRLKLSEEQSSSYEQVVRLEKGQKAPEFVSETLDGKKITLATFRGRSVLFLFMSPTCQPCIEGLPNYEALRPNAENAGIAFVLVSTANAEQTQAFVEKFNVKLPILVAPAEENSFSADYKISGTPNYCLVDDGGIVQSCGHPDPKGGEWKKIIDSWAMARPKVKVADPISSS